METTVAEEKKYNPRLTKSLTEFVDIMNNLNLPYPAQLGKFINALINVYVFTIEKNRTKTCLIIIDIYSSMSRSFVRHRLLFCLVFLVVTRNTQKNISLRNRTMQSFMLRMYLTLSAERYSWRVDLLFIPGNKGLKLKNMWTCDFCA